jgi:nicotinamidase-related amidase
VSTVLVPAGFYQQFDADVSREYPAESYGGWMTQPLPLSIAHTALVVMHAWDVGTAQEYPGLFRACEYLQRSYHIAREVFPPLLAAVRAAGVSVLHVVGGPQDYYSHLPGYRPPAAAAARGEAAEPDPVHRQLRDFRTRRVFPGAGNLADMARGNAAVDFLPSAVPADGEAIVASTEALLRQCRATGVNHLVYAGFALDDCMLTSPGGMVDMSRHGFLCSTVRQAVTAIENRETVRAETAKQVALWRVALHFGFVYDDADLIAALRSAAQ